MKTKSYKNKNENLSGFGRNRHSKTVNKSDCKLIRRVLEISEFT